MKIEINDPEKLFKNCFGEKFQKVGHITRYQYSITASGFPVLSVAVDETMSTCQGGKQKEPCHSKGRLPNHSRLEEKNKRITTLWMTTAPENFVVTGNI